MPFTILALATVIWIAVRVKTTSTEGALVARRDGAVAVVLTIGWLALWVLYLTYTWTAGQTVGHMNPVHVIRFYLPALGLLSLLASWIVVRLPRWTAPVLLVVLFGLGLWYYAAPSNDTIVHGPPPPVSRQGQPSSPTPAS
jgi:hypothetical protein